MKRFAVIIFATVLLTSATLSCSSMGKTEEQTSHKNGTVSGNPEEFRLPNGWKYETEITHAGSRSEGSVSRLFYENNEIPPVFNLIMIGDRAFEYRPMKNIWDNYGYIESVPPFRPECAPKNPVSNIELQKGWYTDVDRRYREGTPSTWIYAETSVLKVWCAPEKINDFITHFDLKEIPGGPVLMKTK